MTEETHAFSVSTVATNMLDHDHIWSVCFEWSNVCLVLWIDDIIHDRCRKVLSGQAHGVISDPLGSVMQSMIIQILEDYIKDNPIQISDCQTGGDVTLYCFE